MNLMKKVAIMIFVLSSLTACGDSQLIKETTTIDIPTIDANLPQATDLEDVDWKVYTSDDLKIIENSNGVVLFTLTQPEYEKLGRNLVELRRYIMQLKQTVVFYRNQNQRKKSTTTSSSK